MVPGCHAPQINPNSLRSFAPSMEPVKEGHGKLVPIRRDGFKVNHRLYVWVDMYFQVTNLLGY